MTSALQQTRPRDLDPRDAQEAVDDARRRGITQLQVLAVIRPDTADKVVLLLDRHHDEVWSLPVAWVRPTETVARTLDWLCDEHLGLSRWRADFAGDAVYRAPDGTEVLQLAFDVTVPADGALAWSGPCQWWHPSTEPPTLHRLARPMMEQLHTPDPELEAEVESAPEAGPESELEPELDPELETVPEA